MLFFFTPYLLLFLSLPLHFSHSPLFDHTSRLSSILPLLPSLTILLLPYLSSASHFSIFMFRHIPSSISTPSLSDLEDPHLVDVIVTFEFLNLHLIFSLQHPQQTKLMELVISIDIFKKDI